ncbi:hypothetical protein AVDCRST_MAG84-6316 [uncultured Microcoleus sp.]|uniref:Uncharacterized protein n=1 Tax=uncultured Microcoleus sp. TaxID=259945 RepID=A0A6J4P7D6_9CYAN|nr:hypothetical protein AVDCRST_MAG84-6316 [uncultured Microcoleus sp.]
MSGKPSLPIDLLLAGGSRHRLASLPYSKAARFKSLVRRRMAPAAVGSEGFSHDRPATKAWYNQ